MLPYNTGRESSCEEGVLRTRLHLDHSTLPPHPGEHFIRKLIRNIKFLRANLKR